MHLIPRSLLLLLLLLITIYSCAQTTPKEDTKASKKNSAKKITKPDSIIDFPCAVLIYPSSKKIDAMKKRGSEDDFYTAADDNQYYMGISIEYLDSVKTKTIKKESEGSISFKNFEGKTFKMRLDSMYWGIILFNGKSKPIEADILMIQDDYKRYMKQ